jgi:hypothetical protein
VNVPGFTAECAVYRSNVPYRPALSLSQRMNVVIPQFGQNYLSCVRECTRDCCADSPNYCGWCPDECRAICRPSTW